MANRRQIGLAPAKLSLIVRVVTVATAAVSRPLRHCCGQVEIITSIGMRNYRHRAAAAAASKSRLY